MDQNKLHDKVAVVTGAGGTLCSEMARSLARKGVKVALLGRTLEKLQQVENEIEKNGGQAIAVSCDVTVEKDVLQAREKITSKLGRCDMLINGAGGNQAEAITNINAYDSGEVNGASNNIKGFFNLSMDKFRQVIEVNTMGTVMPCFVFGRDMAKNGSGNIINIGSMNSFRPLSRVGAYAMAKAGIASFTQWLATYLAPANIRVNAIAPGFFLNDRSRKLLLDPNGGFSTRGQSIVDHTPMKKFGEAPELTGCVHWLLDDEASGFVTGITIPVDGGFMACSGV